MYTKWNIYWQTGSSICYQINHKCFWSCCINAFEDMLLHNLRYAFILLPWKVRQKLGIIAPFCGMDIRCCSVKRTRLQQKRITSLHLLSNYKHKTVDYRFRSICMHMLSMICSVKNTLRMLPFPRGDKFEWLGQRFKVFGLIYRIHSKC